MGSIRKLRPSPALFVALAALVMAMSGAAVALPGKNTVQKNDIENGAVTGKKIAKGAIGSAQIKGKSVRGNRLKDGAIKEKQLADNAVSGKKIADGAVGEKKIADGAVTAAKVPDGGLSSKKISDYTVIAGASGGFVKLTATEAGSEAAARTAAPATELFKKGQITISAKCFRDTAADTTFAEVYVATAANGAIFNGATDFLPGGNAATDFLNTDTAETDRVLDDEAATAATASLGEGEFTIAAPDGTHLVGQTTVAAKNGTLAGGDGVYGAGNVCLFGGEIAG
jgi:hypothetical protein